jgi:hypothetical protein
MPEYEVSVVTKLIADTPEEAAEFFLELLSDPNWATHVDATDLSTGATTSVEYCA